MTIAMTWNSKNKKLEDKKRWNSKNQKFEDNKNVEKFLLEIDKVCKKHKMSISHEDLQGAFIIMPYHKENIKWLMNASVEDL